ncbi:DUF6886 family protein [Tumebacillus flagellatus]|uniref:Uncharacterized protein n=1 Tax=Tumebacillus flagellatus TaxID=1157490 RepID=A0A074LNW5_9BACL|nr:hypothetical protein EL26_13680 [Tumebacillus flagellatus]
MLYHFSEEPGIQRFEPRLHPSHPGKPPVVWAIDEGRAPIYFFPRDCPRVCAWKLEGSTEEDVRRFLGSDETRMMIAVEGRWLETLRKTKLYVYHLPEETFALEDHGAGYFTSREAVTPVKVEPVGDLLTRLVEAGVELRITPTLWPLHDALVQSSLHFSMIRMRNAIPR